MLTSHKIENVLPLNLGFAKAEGQALPQGIKFSNVFSAMFGGRSQDVDAGESVDLPSSLNVANAINDAGEVEGSILQSLNLDLGDLRLDELRQMLPPGLQRLADLDSEQLQKLASDLGVDLSSEGGFVDGLGEIVKSLAQLTQADKTDQPMNAQEEIAGHGFSEKVHQLLGIDLPKPQITHELDRRALNKEAAQNLFNVSELRKHNESLPDAINPLIDADTDIGLTTDLDADLGTDLNIATLDAEELVQETVSDSEALGFNQALTIDETFNAEASPVTEMFEAGYVYDDKAVAASEFVKAENIAVSADEIAVDIKEDVSELGFNVAQSANGMSAVSAESAVSAQSASVSRNVQANVSGSSQVNYQANWGSHAADGGEAGGSQMNHSGQGSQSSGNQQSQAGQQQMAQQQMMQFQEQRNQSMAQQAAVKAADELATASTSREGGLGSELGLSERRGQLPVGLQTINVPVKSPQWGQAMAHRVTFMANNQIQQAQITLNPEKLGPIQIKLHFDRDQQVHVSMTAQHGATREAMETAVPRLREMLEQSGMSLASVDVSDQKQFTENSDDQTGSQTAQAGTKIDSNELEEEVLPVNTVVSDNIVDYYA